jgi:Sjoegren syndrome nuclear autoantigen 1
MYVCFSIKVFCCSKQLNLGIEDLCGKRDELQRQIFIEEEDKHKLEHEIRLASEKLAKINENLAKKITARTEFDRTISETEAAYMKILESSQTLLNVTFISLSSIQFPFFVLFF